MMQPKKDYMQHLPRRQTNRSITRNHASYPTLFNGAIKKGAMPLATSPENQANSGPLSTIKKKVDCAGDVSIKS
jgi:hypothetical protein